MTAVLLMKPLWKASIITVRPIRQICAKHQYKRLTLQDATVTLDNNWDTKHVVSC